MGLGLLGAGGAAMMAALPSRIAAAKDDEGITTSSHIPVSPSHVPWRDPFRVCPAAVPVDLDGLGLDEDCNNWRTLCDGGTTELPHQQIAQREPQIFYHHEVREFQHSFSSSWGTSTMWGFGRVGDVLTTTPGPVIRARYGEPVLVRLTNRLPADHAGFGVPEPSIHLHNGHTPTESDGNPVDYVLPGQSKDHYYPNIYAGGDEREALGSLWYHDHHLDHTAENVYAGLAGQYLLFDHLDTGGDETTGLRLPSGEHDVPMVVGDLSVDADHQPVFDLFNLDGVLGDKQPVNGVIQPTWEVKKRRYRLRIQIAGPARWYHVALWDGAKFLPFWQISTDGNLLEQAIPTSGVRLGVAQRIDIIVDFAKIAASRIYLVNRAEQVNGRGPTGKLLSPGTGLIQINVGAPAPDHSRDPGNAASPGPQSGWMKLRPLPDPDFKALQALAAKAKQRSWVFDRSQGAWTVNGQFFNPDKVSAMVQQQIADAAEDPKKNECWTIKNGGGGWLHPVHMHFEEHRTLSRNGKAPPLADMARKDVVDLSPSEEVKIFFRMRDFKGRYVMHCHNVNHEDHAMMIRFDVV